MSAHVPTGVPIPGVTTLREVRAALDMARRYIFAGGDRTDEAYLAYVDLWLDYRLSIAAPRPEPDRDLMMGAIS